ncbi:CCA tRNA nucleotidyltransferase [bacterium]|nr:MAG: CCA tRNA nucleotidyltransferase [bacterium]
MQAKEEISATSPVRLSRQEHPLSRSLIDPDVLWIMRKLRSEGFLAYLVGGAVRDILLGREPNDFDIGTDARPSQIKHIFRNCRLVGRRFRIAHVFFRRRGEPDKVVEVTTFRGPAGSAEGSEMHPEDMDHTGAAFGSPEDDALRRDFTVNSLFYDFTDFTILDYTGGLKDLEAGIIRLIGDPDERFAEDPVRMLRALEFAARLDFSIEEATLEGIRRNAPLISGASRARLREELRQMQQKAITARVLSKADELGLFKAIYPNVRETGGIFHMLEWLDQRVRAGEEGPEFAYVAAMALPGIAKECPFGADISLELAAETCSREIGELCAEYQLAAHIRHNARELVMSLYRIGKGKNYRSKGRFARKPEFRFAWEFCLKYAEIREELRPALEYWRAFVEGKSSETPAKKGRPRRRRRRPNRKPEAAQ